MKVDEEDQVALVLRNREFDRYARDFLTRNPRRLLSMSAAAWIRASSAWIMAGSSGMTWICRKSSSCAGNLIGGEEARYHLLAHSAFDSTWLDTVSVHRPRAFLFLAEGVLMYFDEAQVKSLVLALREHFPGAELVFDAFSPFLVRMNNLRISRTKIGARYHWGLKRGKDLERWGDGITLLDEWFPFDRPEPRLAHAQWMRHVPLLARVMGIFHYRLGTATG